MITILSNEEFQNQILSQDGYYFADFFADWCGPCKMILPIYEEVAEEVKSIESQITMLKINRDNLMDNLDEYGFRFPTIPRFVGFVVKDGKVTTVQDFGGTQGRERMLSNVLAGYENYKSGLIN